MTQNNEQLIKEQDLLDPYKIKCLREYLQLKQQELSVLLGQHKGSVYKYEKGEVKPSRPTRILMIKISENPHLVDSLLPPKMAADWKQRLDSKSELLSHIYNGLAKESRVQ